MNREHFFITDEHGYRHYWKDIKRIHDRWSWMRRHWYLPAMMATITGIIGFLLEKYDDAHPNSWGLLSGPLIFFAAVGVFITFVFLFPGPGHELVSQWDREWHYLNRDKAHSAEAASQAAPTATQQPHGHRHDEGTI